MIVTRDLCPEDRTRFHFNRKSVFGSIWIPRAFLANFFNWKQREQKKKSRISEGGRGIN